MTFDIEAFKKFHEANKNKECAICGTGVEVALFEIHQISDGKYVSDGNTLILCNRDIEMLFDGIIKHSFIDLFNFWLGNYELPVKKELKDIGELIKEFEKETGKSIFKSNETGINYKEGLFVVVTDVCNKCGDSLDMKLDSEIAHIPFEGIRSCKCGNPIKTKWNGKELKYL